MDVQLQLYRESRMSLRTLCARIFSENRKLWEKKRTLVFLYSGLGVSLETRAGVTSVVFKKPGSYWHDAMYVACRLENYWTFLLSEEYCLWRASW